MMKLSAVLIALFMLTCAPAYAQPSNISPNPKYLYLVSYSDSADSVWQMNLSDSTATLLFSTLGQRTAQNDIRLSKDEAAYMKTILSNPYSGLSGVYLANRAAERVWSVDTQHILVETNNALCDAFSQNNCFGYYEFLLVDISSKVISSLYKVDYHPLFLSSWQECQGSPNLRIYIDSLAPNPTHKLFAMTLRGIQDCYSIPHYYSILVDYSRATVRTENIDTAGGMAWSPNGEKLAYFGKQCPTFLSANQNCTLSIKVQLTSAGNPFLIDTQSILATFAPPNVLWADNNNLIYEWTRLANGDEAAVITNYNFTTKVSNTVAFNAQFTDQNILLLNTGGVLFGKKFDRENELIASQQRLAAAQTEANTAQNAFFNNRLPDYLILGYGSGCLTHLTILDAAMNRMSVDLTNVLLQTECVISANV